MYFVVSSLEISFYYKIYLIIHPKNVHIQIL